MPARDFDGVAARLRAILAPYRGHLEPSELYGVDTLKRPGGGVHDYFAGMRVGKRYVSFYLMPVYSHALLARLLGRERVRSRVRR
jgi:hypothetical protein